MANFLKVFKIGIIGGSSSTNSKGAALSLMNAMKNKESICIIPDGPQGPSMVMTSSPIYYAKKSQKPIICSVYSVENSKIMKKTWDNMLIPRPFSRGIFQAVGPYYIPEDATDADINEYAKKIEEDMNNVLLSIDKELGLPKVEIGKVSRKKQKKLEKEK